jgi:carbon monoxide dehydrogenase subunit G
MIENQVIITIDRPADVVFAHLTNPKNFANFDSVIEKTSILSQTPAAVGSEFTMDIRDVEQRIPVTFRVTRFDPHRFFAYESVLGTDMSIVVRYFLEDEGSKTQITYHQQIDPGDSIDQARADVIQRETQQRIERDFQQLKAALEGISP